MTRLASTLTLPLVPALLLAVGCGSEATAPGRFETPPNIVLVTVDTLRADHVSCYGYPRDTTPRLDALAAQGVRFVNTVSTSGATVPAHLSLLTSLFTHQHDYTANRAVWARPIESAEGRSTVAEALRSAGYSTAAVVAAAPVSSKAGFDLGFDEFYDPGKFARDGVQVNADVLAWLDKYGSDGRDAPFFLWIHYWDVHEPNEPVEPYASLFPEDELLEQIIAERRIDPAALQREIHPAHVARYFFHDLYLQGAGRKPEIELPPLEMTHVRSLINRYDGDVRAVDDRIGEVIDELQQLQLWDRTIFVVTADHGQSLGQHTWLGHELIHGELIDVPLIMRFPGDLVPQPQRVDRVVSLIDVMPTVLARLDVPGLEDFFVQARGADALDAGFDRPFALSQRADRDDEELEQAFVGLTSKGWRYFDRDEEELYDLGADPRQFDDVAEEHEQLLAKLRALTQAALSDQGPAFERGQGGAASEELRRAMEALGYGGSAEEGSAEEGSED